MNYMQYVIILVNQEVDIILHFARIMEIGISLMIPLLPKKLIALLLKMLMFYFIEELSKIM